MKDPYGSLGRASANHRALGQNIGSKLLKVLAVAPRLRHACLSALGCRKAEGPSDKHLTLRILAQDLHALFLRHCPPFQIASHHCKVLP
eukprot:3113676-Amphidinium_carterae.1